jgi:hypothetical protein
VEVVSLKEACQQCAAVPGHHHLFAAPDFDLVS